MIPGSTNAKIKRASVAIPWKTADSTMSDTGLNLAVNT